jgi:enoyl-CoA hydratase/carnithine racemase
VDRDVATITLNRPRQRNAVGDGMREHLADAYLWCDRTDAIRAVVLTGAPPAFCAGADITAGERTFTDPGPTFSAAGVDVAAWSVPRTPHRTRSTTSSAFISLRTRGRGR